MPSLPPDLHALVDALDAEVVVDARRPDPPAHAARALARPVDVRAVLAPGAPPAPEQRIVVPSAPFALARLVALPDVVRLVTVQTCSVLRGAVVAEDGRALVFDTAAAPMTVLHGDWLIDAASGRVRVWTITRADTPAALAPEGGDDLPVPDWPGLEALLGERSCPDWLRHRLDMLASSPDPVDRLVAAGLLVRLWTPADRAERARALADARARRPEPTTAVRRWLAGFSAWPVLEEVVLDRAGRLEGDLARLADLALEDEETAQGAASQAVAERDDLASLVCVLDLAGRPAVAARTGVARVDRAAAIHGAALAELALVDETDPWLGAVYTKEPERWWGQLLR